MSTALQTPGVPLAARLPASSWSLLLAASIVSVCATLGALVLGEVMGMEPCVLCWYQRVAMFPLALILSIGAYREDRGCIRYALPLSIAGVLIAGYHLLLYSGFIPADLQPCGKGPSCSQQDLQLAGFVSIPLMSFAAFVLITACLVLARRASSR
jgi:disulfide bond formation protein DsbB